MDALHGVVAFRHHAHLELRHPHRKPVADHVSEHPVAAVARVGRHQQVTEIDGVVEAVVAGENLVHEVLHLLHAVGDVGGDEVVAVAEAAVDAGTEGVDVLHDDGQFGTLDVLGDRGADVAIGEHLGHVGGKLLVFGGGGEEGELLLRNLLRVRRPADHGDAAHRDGKLGVQIVGDELQRLGDDTLHCGDDLFPVEAAFLKGFQRPLEERRRGDHNHVVGLGDHLTEVVADFHVFRIDKRGAQVFRVMSVLADALHNLLFAHPPVDMLQVGRKDFHDGSGPAASADYCHPVSQSRLLFERG